jgi:DNA-binding NtrC family response regulator
LALASASGYKWRMSSARDSTTAALSRDVVRPALGAVLRVLNASASPERYRLRAGSCRIGAGRGCDLVIADSAVSRDHVRLTLVPEGVAVEDLGSKNGTFYLGQRVERVILGLGSRVSLGRVELAIEPDRAVVEKLRPSELTEYGELVGVSPAMRRLFAVLARLEGTLVNLLIEGESGTGKELLARAVHRHSAVSAGPFVAVNCGAIDRNLARSELFGHRRGSFTGATNSRPGAFEEANGGTLLLDEIGEAPLEIQPMLLRALEVGAVVRVGETRERPVKVRLLAATNRDLEQDVRAGRFREDLFYRLNVVRVRVPPLRERPEDIELLARHLGATVGIAAPPADFVAELRQRAWPGNVRELRNALCAYAALGTLSTPQMMGAADDLESALRRAIDAQKPYAPQKEHLLYHFMRTYLGLLLDQTRGNQSEAARISGLERSHINRMLPRLGLVDAAERTAEPQPSSRSERQ